MKSSMRKHIIMEEYNLGRSALKKIKPKSWKKRKKALLNQCYSAESTSDHVRPKLVFTEFNGYSKYHICLFCGKWFVDELELEPKQAVRIIKRKDWR